MNYSQMSPKHEDHKHQHYFASSNHDILVQKVVFFFFVANDICSMPLKSQFMNVACSNMSYDDSMHGIKKK